MQKKKSGHGAKVEYTPARERCFLVALREGERARLLEIPREHALYTRLQNMGWQAGAEISCVRSSPAGDPIAYRSCGVTAALRAADAATIVVEPLPLIDFDVENSTKERKKQPLGGGGGERL
jgi:ferrous iron transport protein A